MGELKVAVVQSNARPADLAASVQDHVRLATNAAERGARLALFPELSLTGYSRELTRSDAVTASDPRVNALQGVADAHDIVVVAGAPLDSPSGLLIAALCFVPNQDVIIYSKQYLHDGEEVAFAPGGGGKPLMIDDKRVCLAICAEITHPEHASAAHQQGADVYAASCFITPDGYAADTALLEGYSAEHRMSVLMANYGSATSQFKSAGGSAIWSHTGVLLARGPAEGEAVVVATLVSSEDKERG